MARKTPNPRPTPMSQHMAGFTVTHSQVERAFTEWDRRYREEPDTFDNEVEHLLRNTPETYGARAAVYFTKVLADLFK